MASRSRSRNPASPSSVKMVATGLPAPASMVASTSTKLRPSRLARASPTALLPEPIMPISTIALGPAGPVAVAPKLAVLEEDLVVGLGPPHVGLGEGVADLDALDGLDRHQVVGEAGVDLAVPVDVGAESGRDAVGDDLEHPAEAV